jgi:hypothetical protein
MTYKQVKDSITGNIANCIIRTSDSACIPFDHANTDYQAYLKWLAEGGVPQEADDVSSQ